MKIFLDDERSPSDPKFFDFVVRDYNEFYQTLIIAWKKYSKIDYISFDHDLGTGPTGYDCAKKLVELDMEYDILSPSFSFHVHSQNPIGKNNIEKYITKYLEIKHVSDE